MYALCKFHISAYHSLLQDPSCLLLFIFMTHVVPLTSTWTSMSLTSTWTTTSLTNIKSYFATKSITAIPLQERILFHHHS